MPKNVKSRYIKKATDNKIREASGFRCAWCGKYLTERHHIKQLKLGGDHSPDNLILLCPDCHSEADKGIISYDELMKRRIELSGKVDRSSGCLSINKEYLILNTGGCRFTNCKNILTFNDVPLITMENDKGYLLLSMRLFNEVGNLICWMNRNRWWIENNAILNFQFSRYDFSIKDEDGIKILNLHINDDVVELNGNLHLMGDIILITRDVLLFHNHQNYFSGDIRNYEYAFVIQEKGFDSKIQKAAFRMEV